MFSCEFHIKQEFARRGPQAVADGKLYSEAVHRSKRNKDAVAQTVGRMTTSYGRHLLEKSVRESVHLFPADLPDRTGTHGNTTGNVAEVSHRLFEMVRSEQSLYRSMRTAVEVLHRRATALQR